MSRTTVTPKNISQIQVIFKTHLDMGFTDLARNVVRCYVDRYIPSAMQLARETRNLPERFVWTMGSWLVYHFLEVTRGKDRRRMEEAIQAGDIYWHALPFTTHTELMDADLFRHGLRYSQRLDARFGRKTSAAKMTDVPGHTKAMVPLLAESGIRLLHIGVNPASTIPAVPAVFLWRCDGAEVVVVYEKDYGSTTELPGGMAMSINLTGDNHGPQNPEQIHNVYDKLRSRYPQAKAVSGTLTTVADWMWPRRKSLPVVSSEIGDTWIHGVGTDPAKTARFRTLCRVRSHWIASNKLKAGGKADFAFAEKLLLVAEHTWGMDIKTHLGDWVAYSPAKLRHALNKPNFRLVARSWQEQRAYLNQATRALPPALSKQAGHEMSALKITRTRGPSKKVPLQQSFRLGPWQIGLAADGSISHLQREGDSRSLADKQHRLGSLGYQLFSSQDYHRFYRQYNTLDVDWARKDFTKPGMSDYDAAWHAPALKAVELNSDHSARARLVFPAVAVRYGAPAVADLYLSAHPEGIDLRLEWREKQANRLPEALWMAFNPRLPRGAGWLFEKMGSKIDPLDVIKDGNRHLHAVDGKIVSKDFSIFSVDAPLVAPGRPCLLNFTNQQPDLRAGVSCNLYNNVWGTNFPMWYSDDAVFRFQLRWTK